MKLDFGGHLIDVDAEGLYNWVESNLVAPIDIVGIVYMSHQAGNPSVVRVEHLSILERVELNITDNMVYIDHEGILNAIQAIIPGLKNFNLVSNELVDWQELNMTEADGERIEERFMRTGELPPEMRSGEYQVLLKKSSESLSIYLDGLEVAIERVGEFATELSEHPDLNLLKKAVEYSDMLRQIIQYGYVEGMRKMSDTFSDSQSA